MDIVLETNIFLGHQHKAVGEAKITSLAPRFYNSGLRELYAVIEIRVQPLSHPESPRTSANQQLEPQTENFIHSVQCDVLYNSSKIARLSNASIGFENGVAYVHMDAPLSLESIQYIENTRRGSDVLFRLDLRFSLQQRSWWIVKQNNDIKGMSPYTFTQTNLRGGWHQVKIAASDWTTEFLPGFSYDSPYSLTLPRLPADLIYGSARNHMNQAFEALKGGTASYRAVPSHCLNALDALAKSFGYNNFSSVPELAPESDVHERKAVIQKFKNYINRWRHDQTGKGSNVESLPTIEHEEAMFIYVTTSYLIQLMAKLTPQSP